MMIAAAPTPCTHSNRIDPVKKEMIETWRPNDAAPINTPIEKRRKLDGRTARSSFVRGPPFDPHHEAGEGEQACTGDKSPRNVLPDFGSNRGFRGETYDKRDRHVTKPKQQQGARYCQPARIGFVVVFAVHQFSICPGAYLRAVFTVENLLTAHRGR